MSTRQMRSNHGVRLAGRRATLAITVAALGLGAGSSLAEAAEDAPTTDPVTAEELLVVELVIEAPPIEEPTSTPPVPEPIPVPDAPTDAAATSDPVATDAIDDSSTAVTSEPTDVEAGEDGHDSSDDGNGQGGSDDGHDSSDDGHDGSDGGGHDGGDGGHDGGQGKGNPYRMTFSVDWRSVDGTPIAVLDGMLPDDWRNLFELTAASRTGRNQPTSARCTYAETSDDLVCEFDNPGHRSEAEGLIVPARPTATYSVTVVWNTTGWTIAGANAGPYSARDLCPRGDGGGHDSDHEGGHDSDHEGGHESLTEEPTDVVTEEPGGRTFVCNHEIVIQRIAVVVPEPEDPTDPTPPTEPTQPTAPPAPELPPEPASPPPPTVPTQAVLPPTTVTVASIQQTLPATGSQSSLMLAIGAALAAIGAGLALAARREAPDPIGAPVDDRGRMPS